MASCDQCAQDEASKVSSFAETQLRPRNAHEISKESQSAFAISTSFELERVDDNTGSLEINVQKKDNQIVVEFIDNGPGIPDHVLPKIFDPFFTTKAAGEGSGLGLDICSKIIKKHDGVITVDTKPGRTAFQIKLPINVV